MNELLNRKIKMNGLELLDLLDKESIKVVFFDPQYRGVLDKLSYGNEGKSRGKDRSALPQMSQEIIFEFLAKIELVLKPNGYLFLWLDKFHLFEVKSWIENYQSLEIVDMVTWVKGNKFVNLYSYKFTNKIDSKILPTIYLILF